MDESPPTSRLSLCTLPLESRQAILGHLDDLHALKAGSGHIERLLSEGLPFLAKVITADSYEERCRLLTRKASSSAIFLPSDVRDNFHSDIDETVPLKDYTAEQLKSLEGSKRSDTDPGPAEAWHHAHLELDRLEFVASERVRELRRWGYVIWDYVTSDWWKWGFSTRRSSCWTTLRSFQMKLNKSALWNLW